MSLKYDGKLISLAKSMRKNATPWENKLWYEFLRNYPVRFQRQKVIGSNIVDFYCAKARLAVELDGGGHYTEKQKTADEVRTQHLKRMGVEVLRFSNLDVDQSFYEVCSAIDDAVKETTDIL